MTIIISEKGSGTTRLDPRGIPQKTFLQDYVQDHPEVLPMNEIREDIQLFVVAKEFSTKSGAIDVLALDQDGRIYIIETKLYKNPDKRFVLAQAMDYGAALWDRYAGEGSFVEDLRSAVVQEGGYSLDDALVEWLDLDQAAVALLLDDAVENVEDGNFHFVVLMDQMDERLKTLISFVNQNSRFSVHGVELDFYQHDDLEVVIPRMYGAEVRKEVSISSSERRRWDEASFFDDAEEKLDTDRVAVLRDLYEYCKSTADSLDWGTGATSGSFNPKYKQISPTKSIMTVGSDGVLYLKFGWLENSGVAREFIEEFSSALSDELGLDLPPEFQGKYPRFEPDKWIDSGQTLKSLLDRTLRRLEIIN